MTVLPYLCEESQIRVEENSGKANDSLPNINVISTLAWLQVFKSCNFGFHLKSD